MFGNNTIKHTSIQIPIFVSISYNQSIIPNMIGYMSHFALYTNFYTECFTEDKDNCLPTLQSISQFVQEKHGTLGIIIKENARVSAKFVHFMSENELINPDFLNSIKISATIENYADIS